MMNEDHSQHSIPGMDWAFLKRSVIATVVTTALVALCAAAYFPPAWSGRYLVFSLWALAFFTMTGLIFKYLLFESRRGLGLICVAAKIALLGAMIALLMLWPVNPDSQSQIAAIIAGLTTPLAVVTLRAISWFIFVGRKNIEAEVSSAPADPETGRMKSHS